MIVRTLVGAVVGAVIGFFGVVIGTVATIGLAFATESDAAIPYVIEASYVEVGGLPELQFMPNSMGMLVVVALFAAATAVYSATTGQRRRHESGIAR